MERQYNSQGKMIFSSRKFSLFRIGINKYYNDKGVLEKTIINDYCYTFSVENMIKKMRKEYNIELNNFVYPGNNIHLVLRIITRTHNNIQPSTSGMHGTRWR